MCRFPCAARCASSRVIARPGHVGNLSLALIVLTQIAPTPQAASAYTGMGFLVGYLPSAQGAA